MNRPILPKIELNPGAVIELANTSQLASFEEMVARQVCPDMTDNSLYIWQGRMALKEIVRPPKFNGSIVGIRMEVLDEPYERLLQAKADKVGFVSGITPGKVSDSTLEKIIELSKGFAFTADAKSSAAGVSGIIQSQLFYAPRIPSPNNRSVDYHGPISRYVTRPVIDQESLQS